jgi:hypothetical protein
MWCGLALSGSQGGFQLLAQALDFLLEPFDLPLLLFDLSLGLLQLLLGNERNRIRLISLLSRAACGSHPPLQ